MVKNYQLMLVIIAFTSFTWAAIPEKLNCTSKTVLNSAQDLTHLPSTNITWDCLELSALPKSDLMTIADKAPKLTLKLSNTNISRTDFDDLQKKIQLDLIVDSKKLGRTDLIELSKLGAKLTIYSNTTIFNTIDYSEISAAGPFTLIIQGNQFTFKELSELASNKKIALVLDGNQSNPMPVNYDELLKINPDIQLIP